MRSIDKNAPQDWEQTSWQSGPIQGLKTGWLKEKPV